MRWKKIPCPGTEDFQEWHKEVMTKPHGRVMLKVWLSFAGEFMVSMTNPSAYRSIKRLEASTAEGAKAEAEEWALHLPALNADT